MARQNQQTMNLPMDPFLSGITDHTRQESGDSGLSLSSNNYSMPQISDPFSTLDIDDSMDCTSGMILFFLFLRYLFYGWIIKFKLCVCVWFCHFRKWNGIRLNEHQFRNYR